MLARLGVRYVLVGHSERRRLFAMTDELVAATLRAVLRHSMTPILLRGGDRRGARPGPTEERLPPSSRPPWRGLDADELASLVIAYEPMWAIGTGRAATAGRRRQDACAFIRGWSPSWAGPRRPPAVRIQYGGSVNAENAADLVAEPDIDGLLVGGASLEAGRFRRRHPGGGGCYRSLPHEA